MSDRRSLALRIAAETGHDPRTVLSVFDGRTVRRATRTAVETAAARLNVDIASVRTT